MLRLERKIGVSTIQYLIHIGKRRVLGAQRWMSYDYDTYAWEFFYHGPKTHLIFVRED